MKFAAILLLTTNLWASFFCCCQELSCTRMDEAACSAREAAVSLATESRSHCHGDGNVSDETTSTPHHTQDREKDAARDSSKRAQGSVMVTNTCRCGNHASSEVSFALPNPQTAKVTVWLVLDLFSWLANHPHMAEKSSASFEELCAFVPLPKAPSLSVLSRFLI
ncbi:hypothetical protein SCOR_33230 [Sulfidibacter corallicola]|uniref:Secreted protein n=1 Tax=Sulfidibacter corallicola TaxID=2818388 RepID=A0A8A4TL49_SULCO|nr:hypothetical protein [Sulfidibacter corallicola]QTD49601.1 hypothetical protein J3U87_28775 [Sulfidibacter corallicola]